MGYQTVCAACKIAAPRAVVVPHLVRGMDGPPPRPCMAPPDQATVGKQNNVWTSPCRCPSPPSCCVSLLWVFVCALVHGAVVVLLCWRAVLYLSRYRGTANGRVYSASGGGWAGLFTLPGLPQFGVANQLWLVSTVAAGIILLSRGLTRRKPGVVCTVFLFLQEP